VIEGVPVVSVTTEVFTAVGANVLEPPPPPPPLLPPPLPGPAPPPP
jgi:hypothetical protein